MHLLQGTCFSRGSNHHLPCSEGFPLLKEEIYFNEQNDSLHYQVATASSTPKIMSKGDLSREADYALDEITPASATSPTTRSRVPTPMPIDPGNLDHKFVSQTRINDMDGSSLHACSSNSISGEANEIMEVGISISKYSTDSSMLYIAGIQSLFAE